MSQEQYKWNELLWKPIVRPPRHRYNLKDLGNETFKVQDTITRRTDFEIHNNRNQKLQCSLFEPLRMQEKPHPCMIYLHGNSSSRIESFTIIEYLIPANISVCGIDLSGSGLSEGEYISLGFHESKDVICLYDYLRENKGYLTSIGLWGRSMGSVTAILAAHNNYEFKVLVCDSPFSNLTLLCKELAKANYKIPNCCFNCFWCCVKSKIHQEVKFNIDELNIVQIIQVLPQDVQILFLSAQQDDLIRESHPKLLMKLFPGENKELFSFEGTHNSRRPAKILQESVRFVCKAFGQKAWTEVQITNTTKYSQTQLSKQIPLLKGDRKSVQPYIEKSEY
ncbi:unnamed protein product (macronuclear) [Paramecium tetraurelia]|uniref:Serine aminopeptidase S33 domain-containing protein n=1 Tax=Paramecium tetraurelia TaxID=5888 RepID=A0DBV6_PARTE|nr:uncharacterized protein GSPATT00015400001 [Paramecium tetraurelia]CAK80523.1 unnamed protein product [Paramecium tetraurelia]|eukprot:XP_001447920.1 hypothetical protein (macronuclear) [Paramecium tetraurelia strain d4-2]